MAPNPSWYNEDVRDVSQYYKNHRKKRKKSRVVKKSRSLFNKLFRRRRKSYETLKEEEEEDSPQEEGRRLGHQVSDLSERIRILLESNPNVYRAILATNLRLHQNNPWEAGWGCGYRNLQTLVDSIACDQVLSEASGLDSIPTFLEIQGIIEEAWQAGFDPDGARSMRNSVISSTKWLGASDVATFLQVPISEDFCKHLNFAQKILL
ncbi:unnamed protein product [Gongylonema pulchrum]|uniref:Zinc finger with UFM1-specific peptidase domain protein n=1 Tax=Gongylonema pulchrum TaxID=637853 RepID=A0A183D5V5_9BILA|nr:unnamed protein product [Gongylonema pulchrum]